MNRYTSLALSFFVCTTAFAATAPFTEDDFQINKTDKKFEDVMATIDLEDSKYAWEFKTSSTSVGVKISIAKVDDEGNPVLEEDGKPDMDKLGTWLPKNSAADPESQVVAHYLGQFLQMTDYVVPSDYLPLGPKATARFAALLGSCTQGGKMWDDNCNALKAQLKKNPNSLFGILRDHTKDEVEVPGMIANASPNGTLNTKSVIGKFISASGPMPSAEKKMNLGVKFPDPNDPTEKKKITPEDTELNLARQFSKIMVLDILTGQWDRFSGGNIEAVYNKKKDVVQFIARDNGGASMNGPGYSQYYKFLTRFDAGQIQRVERLLSLLESNPDEVKAALQMRSKVDSLKNRCKKLLDYVKAVEAEYGAEKTYFPATDN